MVWVFKERRGRRVPFSSRYILIEYGLFVCLYGTYILGHKGKTREVLCTNRSRIYWVRTRIFFLSLETNRPDAIVRKLKKASKKRPKIAYFRYICHASL